MHIGFTSDHRAELHDLGLTTPKVDLLESDLRVAEESMRPQAPRNEVLAELTALRDAACRLVEVASPLQAADQSQPHLFDATLRLYDAGISTLGGVVEEVEMVAQAADSALISLNQAKQTRRRASYWPVKLIADRLGPAFKPTPTEGSEFRRIIAICYEAMGARTESRRAIDNYMKWLKKQKSSQQVG